MQVQHVRKNVTGNKQTILVVSGYLMAKKQHNNIKSKENRK